jgi:hypothetical protein
MTCQVHQDAMLDLARGAAVDPSVARSAQAHLETCPGCAAELQRQRDLTGMLTELSSHARSWKPPVGLENRLAQTFAVGYQAMGGAGTGAVTKRARYGALAGGVAAMLALLLWISWPARQPGISPTQPVDRAGEKPHVNSPPLRAAGSSESEAAPVRSTPPRASRRGHAQATRQTAAALEFMPIPGAAGLPAFESGRIVRVELPMSALPSYGVAIVPDAMRSAVEADVLVGQDGQARGIRLVSPAETVQRSRQ